MRRFWRRTQPPPNRRDPRKTPDGTQEEGGVCGSGICTTNRTRGSGSFHTHRGTSRPPGDPSPPFPGKQGEEEIIAGGDRNRRRTPPHVRLRSLVAPLTPFPDALRKGTYVQPIKPCYTYSSRGICTEPARLGLLSPVSFHVCHFDTPLIRKSVCSPMCPNGHDEHPFTSPDP